MEKQRLCDLCSTYIYSECEGTKKAEKYITQKLAYPDKGSDFDNKIGIGKYLFRVPFINELIISAGIKYLQRKGYDALMMDISNNVIGHTAFQIHEDDSLHIFSIEVHPVYRGNGLARKMVEGVIGYARKREMPRLRVGGGKHEASNRLHQHFSKRDKELSILANNGNWLEILY